MKINGTKGTGKTSQASKSKGSQKSSGAGFGKMLDGVGATASSAATETAGAVSHTSQIEALLAIQESDDATSGGKSPEARATLRAETLLEKLENIRIGLLTGTMPKSHLHSLAHTISSYKDQVSDPQLAEILNEIDLRAQIELAKLSFLDK